MRGVNVDAHLSPVATAALSTYIHNYNNYSTRRLLKLLIKNIFHRQVRTFREVECVLSGGQVSGFRFRGVSLRAQGERIQEVRCVLSGRGY